MGRKSVYTNTIKVETGNKEKARKTARERTSQFEK